MLARARRRLEEQIEVGAYLALYLALDWISLLDPIGAVDITPWNPPAGLTFALLLLRGPRRIPAVFVAATLANLMLHGFSQAPVALIAWGLIIAAGYGAAAHLLRERFRISPQLAGHNDLALLFAVAGAAAALIAPAAVLLFATAGLLAWAEAGVAALRFWLGDVIGIVVLTPFLLLLADWRHKLGRLRPEHGLHLVAIGFGLWIIFGWEETNHFELSYVLLLPLVWIALRDGLFGATWGIIATQLGLMAAIQLKGYDSGVVTQFQFLMLAVAATGLFLGAVVDERRRAETSLRRHEAELAHASRLQASGEMAMALAHELNQPLTALIGFARACQGVLEAPAAAAEPSRRAAIELIDQTVQQATRAGDIIRGAREFLRRDDSRRVRIEVPHVVEVALDLMRGEAAQHGVRIEVQLPPGLPPLLADPIQIEQVLLNLLRNSIDAMARARTAGASIVLSAVPVTEEPPAVEFAVRDTGPGFPAELVGRLFQPFATTRTDGMGLGLSISRSIVEAHGGRIWLAGSSDRGTEIRFTVPIDHVDVDAG